MTPDYIERLTQEIERREQQARYYDAAEGQQWIRDMLAREDNQRCLDNARGRLAAAKASQHTCLKCGHSWRAPEPGPCRACFHPYVKVTR